MVIFNSYVSHYQRVSKVGMYRASSANYCQPSISCLRTSWDIMDILGEIANININHNGKVSHKTWETVRP